MQEPKLYKYNYEEPSYPPYKEPNRSIELINAVIKTMKRKEFKGKSVGFVCRGSSGMYLASRCVEKIRPRKTEVIYIRKDGEKSHSGEVGNYRGDLDVYIVIDDFICSGQTINKIVNKLKTRFDFTNKNVGIIAGDCYSKRYKYEDQNFFKFYII